ncbi:MAG TPA: OmpA family protein [Woeseiaceae bacterium]|nr:OmpA family protein [Woeseiaceae bacterium]
MNERASFTGKGFFRAAVLVLLAGTAGLAVAQDALRETFLSGADAALAEANEVDAKLLAPGSYQDGMKDFQAAESGLERGRNIEYVRGKAADATAHFQQAAKTARLAHTVLGQVMKSRQDAANALAPKLAPELWQDAQREFGNAIRELERGDLKDAQRKNIEATALYREAELVAIKDQYLSQTRQLLADAERARVGRYAPITLAKAKQLLDEAEKELNQNRYDTDLPRSLARQANYEAKHALYLSEVVRKVRDDDLTVEQLILSWEEPLARIADAANIVPYMETGHEQLQQELVSYVENLREEHQSLQQEMEASNVRIADMTEEIRALDERLGGATAERTALVKRLEAQARIKAQFEKVEKMFTRDEARVFREGNNIILRMVGLTFASGEAEIRQDNMDLLTKVERAIDVFPQSELIIEGHTDSFGGDEMNQRLSQDRAESVQQYMINAMRIPGYRLIATGFGETNPVANNETASGRAQNRRIDIVIKPNLDDA